MCVFVSLCTYISLSLFPSSTSYYLTLILYFSPSLSLPLTHSFSLSLFVSLCGVCLSVPLFLPPVIGWGYGSLIGVNDRIRVVIKDELRQIPIFGWTMQILLYFFLARNKEKDVPYINNLLKILLDTEDRLSLLLFPEGTDLSESNIIKSNNFAKENGLSACFQVLQPKALGLNSALAQFRGHDMTLHDITVGYDDEFAGRPSELDYCVGKFAKCIHINVEVHEIDDFPNDYTSQQKVFFYSLFFFFIFVSKFDVLFSLRI